MLVEVSQKKTSSAQQAVSNCSDARHGLSLFLSGRSHVFDDQTSHLLHASDDVDVVDEMSCPESSMDLLVLALRL